MCDRLDRISALEDQALSLRDAGDLPAALLAFRQLVQLCEEALAQERPHEVTPLHLAAASRRVADTLLRLGRWSEALVPAKDALRLTEMEAKRRATDVRALRALELSLDLIGRILGRTGKGEAALAMHERSVRIARGLAALAPGDSDLQHDLFGALQLHAWALEDAGRRDAALSVFQQMLRITHVMRERHGADERAMRCEASVRSSLGEVLQKLDRLTEADASLREAVDVYRLLCKRQPECDVDHNFALALRRLAEVEGRRGDLGTAVRHAAESLEIATRAVARDPHDPSRASAAAEGETLLAVLLARQGEAGPAVAHAKAALARRPTRPRKPRPRRPRPKQDDAD